MMDYVYEGYKETYSRFKFSCDKQYFESEIYDKGKEIVEKALKDKVKGFKVDKENSAVYVDLEDKGDIVAMSSSLVDSEQRLCKIQRMYCNPLIGGMAEIQKDLIDSLIEKASRDVDVIYCTSKLLTFSISWCQYSSDRERECSLSVNEISSSVSWSTALISPASIAFWSLEERSWALLVCSLGIRAILIFMSSSVICFRIGHHFPAGFVDLVFCREHTY